MEKKDVKDAVLEAMELSLQAQLRAVRRARRRAGVGEAMSAGERTSQTDMAQYVLRQAKQPLHIQEILEGIERAYHRRLNRDSLVSAILKKAQRGEMFEKVGPNRFGVKGGH